MRAAPRLAGYRSTSQQMVATVELHSIRMARALEDHNPFDQHVSIL